MTKAPSLFPSHMATTTCRENPEMSRQRHPGPESTPVDDERWLNSDFCACMMRRGMQMGRGNEGGQIFPAVKQGL